MYFFGLQVDGPLNRGEEGLKAEVYGIEDFERFHTVNKMPTKQKNVKFPQDNVSLVYFSRRQIFLNHLLRNVCSLDMLLKSKLIMIVGKLSTSSNDTIVSIYGYNVFSDFLKLG